jgi:hypothetical protein
MFHGDPPFLSSASVPTARLLGIKMKKAAN